MPVRFLSELHVRSLPGSAEWELTRDLMFMTRDNREFRAPTGSFTDLFSTPGLLRGFLFRSRRYVEAAVLHDAGYRGTLEERDLKTGEWHTALVSKSYVDKYLLRDPAECLGAPKTLRQTLYWGVKYGGKRSFKGGHK